MNDYKIGFYYHNADSSGFGVHLLLTFDGTSFSFRIINPEILSCIKNCKEPYDKKYPTYCLTNPVVYKEHVIDSHEAIIDEIIFLKDIFIRERGDLRNDGYEIYTPFIESHIITNPCLQDLNCLCDFTGELIIESSIFYNGKEIISPLNRKKDNLSQSQKNISLFNHLVVSGVVIKRIIEECKSFEKYAVFSHKPYHNYYSGYDKKASHDKEIESIINYVKGLNIPAIIDSITADITLEYSYYRGEIDDSYYVLNIRIPDNYKAFRYDCYLSTHLRGHVLRDRFAVYKTGPVDSQKLLNIKDNLKESYSQIEHIACLLAEWQSYAFHNCYYKRYWEDYLAVINYALGSYFNLEYLMHRDSSFKKKYSVELDSYSLYHNTDRIVATFNEDLKTKTACNQNAEKYDRFYSDLLVNIVFAQHAIVCHDVHYHSYFPSGIWHNDSTAFNYSFKNMSIWPPNRDNPMALTYMDT